MLDTIVRAVKSDLVAHPFDVASVFRRCVGQVLGRTALSPCPVLVQGSRCLRSRQFGDAGNPRSIATSALTDLEALSFSFS